MRDFYICMIFGRAKCASGTTVTEQHNLVDEDADLCRELHERKYLGGGHRVGGCVCRRSGSTCRSFDSSHHVHVDADVRTLWMNNLGMAELGSTRFGGPDTHVM